MKNKKKKIVEKKRPSTRKSVNKEFADNTMSRAVFFGMLRAALRSKSRYWPSFKICRDRNKIPYTGINKRRKWLYVCEECHIPYDIKKVNVHHSESCGKLNSFEDLPGFCERLFCSSEKLTLLCEECHKKRHINDKIIENETSK
jgi:hypothetical protein